MSNKKILTAIIISVLIFFGIGILYEAGYINIPFIVKQLEIETLFNKRPSVDTQYSNIKGNTSNIEFTNYVFVGDSRYVGMEGYASDEDTFIAKTSMGHSYLLEQMSNIVAECNSSTALIIGLGVNDVRSNAEKYIETLNQMAEEINCQIYYMSVNPMDESVGASHGYMTKNETIDLFNSQLKENLSDKIIYIDTNSYLKENGYTTQDGLHYTAQTYEDIYNYIKMFVQS